MLLVCASQQLVALTGLLLLLLLLLLLPLLIADVR